jgi:hypothetical protein
MNEGMVSARVFIALRYRFHRHCYLFSIICSSSSSSRSSCHSFSLFSFAFPISPLLFGCVVKKYKILNNPILNPIPENSDRREVELFPEHIQKQHHIKQHTSTLQRISSHPPFVLFITVFAKYFALSLSPAHTCAPYCLLYSIAMLCLPFRFFL